MALRGDFGFYLIYDETLVFYSTMLCYFFIFT